MVVLRVSFDRTSIRVLGQLPVVVAMLAIQGKGRGDGAHALCAFQQAYVSGHRPT